MKAWFRKWRKDGHSSKYWQRVFCENCLLLLEKAYIWKNDQRWGWWCFWRSPRGLTFMTLFRVSTNLCIYEWIFLCRLLSMFMSCILKQWTYLMKKAWENLQRVSLLKWYLKLILLRLKFKMRQHDLQIVQHYVIIIDVFTLNITWNTMS